MSQNFVSSSHLKKSPCSSSAQPHFYSPSSKARSPLQIRIFIVEPIKTTFLAVAIAPLPFLFKFIVFVHTSHANFDFN